MYNKRKQTWEQKGELYTDEHVTITSRTDSSDASYKWLHFHLFLFPFQEKAWWSFQRALDSHDDAQKRCKENATRSLIPSACRAATTRVADSVLI